MALDGFIQVDLTWRANRRELGPKGVINTPTEAEETIRGLVAEMELIDVEQSSDSTIGTDNIDIYFYDNPFHVAADRTFRREDELIYNGNVFTVKSFRYRAEGGFTHVKAKYIERSDLDG